MPTYFDEEGNEIVLESPLEDIQKGFQEREQATAKLKELEEAQLKLNEELNKYKDKDYNFAELRKKAEKKEEDLTTTEKLMLEQQQKIDALSKKINGSWEEKIISQLAGSDEELKKKIQDEFNNLNITAETEAELKFKYEKAYLLATGGTHNVNPASFSQGSSGGFIPVDNKPGKIPTEVKELGKAMGVSEEDFKKYSK